MTALVSFDLDGVLQQNPFQSSRPDGVFGHIERELAPLMPPSAGSSPLRQILDEHLALMEQGEMVASFDWEAIVARLCERLGYSGRLDIAKLVTKYAANAEICYAYAGARQCLQQVTDLGHTLVAITNGYRSYQAPVLRQLGLLDFFQELITPDAAGAAKPEAGIFRAAERYGSPRIHIGDTLPHDVAGANRAGWLSVYIVQAGAPGATELPAELGALRPWERPAKGEEWLQFRLGIDRKWHGYPPCELDESTPDAIVTSLAEIPATVAHLLNAER